MARDESLSPNGDEARTHSTGATARPEISLKRGRAESVEPSHPAETVDATTTVKKNRTVPSTGQTPSKPLDPPGSPNVDSKASANAKLVDPAIQEEDEPESNAKAVAEAGSSEVREEKETNNVGEVRRKVEKMSYKEGEKEELPTTSVEQPVDKPAETVKELGEEPTSKGEDDLSKEEKSASVQEDSGLKRKALDRSQSSYLDNEGVETKRPKDDEPKEAPKKQATFSSFASSSSPFAAGASSSAREEPKTEPKKQATFSSFSSSSSPFTAGKSTTNAFAKSGFGNYSASSSPFASTKGKEESTKEDAAGPSALAEMSKQEKAKEDESKAKMTSQNVSTGEESEDTVYQTRTKLYVLQPDGGWRERGVGMFKLNVRKSDGKGARLVMRAEGVLRLILNVSLYVGQSCLEDGKHIRMTVFEDGERKLITFRTGSSKVANEMYQAIHDHIPVESSVPPQSPTPDPEQGREESKV